jgi:hypothetical protein
VEGRRSLFDYAARKSRHNIMKSARLPLPRRHVAVASCLAFAAIGSNAQDEPSPYWIGVSQSFTHDSNVFRSESGTPKADDWISSTGLLAGLDQPLGRGMLSVDLAANHNKYKNLEQLDNTDHNASVKLDWASIERLSGDVRAYHRRSLQQYEQQAGTGGSSARSAATVRGGAAQLRLGVVTRWTLEGGGAYDESEHQAPFDNRNLRQSSVNAGLRFRPSDLFSWRLGARHSEGKYPRFIDPGSLLVVGDEFKRDDVDLTTTWAPTGNSTLSARVAYTREDHSALSQRSAKFWSGLLNYDWKLTGKTSMRFALSHDSNAGSADIDYGLYSDQSNDTQRRTTAQASVRWDATSKIMVYSSLSHSRRKIDDAFFLTLEGQPPSPQFASGKDRTTTATLGAKYQFSRGLGFACSVSHEKRSVSGDTSGVSYPYDFTTGSCNVQFVLR